MTLRTAVKNLFRGGQSHRQGETPKVDLFDSKNPIYQALMAGDDRRLKVAVVTTAHIMTQDFFQPQMDLPMARDSEGRTLLAHMTAHAAEQARFGTLSAAAREGYARCARTLVADYLVRDVPDDKPDDKKQTAEQIAKAAGLHEIRLAIRAARMQSRQRQHNRYGS